MSLVKNRRSGECGAVVTTVVIWLVVLFVLLVPVPFYILGKIVKPNEVGLRQNYFGLWGVIEKGFAAGGLEPGLHWRIPYISEVILLPRDFQFVNFNEKPVGGELELPVLDVPTRDGSKVKTDVSLIVRLFERPGEASGAAEVEPLAPEDRVPFARYVERTHGGPRDLVTSLTTEQLTQLNRFAGIAEDDIRRELGTLSTTNYYNPMAREHSVVRAYEKINEIVNPLGIELWGALVRRYVYAERNIDDQIFAKNLQEATEALNAEASRLAEAKAETERERALWDAKIKDLRVDGEAKVQVIRADGDLFEASKQAEGDLLVAKAGAEVDRAKADALHEIAGAEIYIGRQLTPLLGTLRGGIVSQIDPYDIDGWVEKLTKQGGVGQ